MFFFNIIFICRTRKYDFYFVALQAKNINKNNYFIKTWKINTSL